MITCHFPGALYDGGASSSLPVLHRSGNLWLLLFAGCVLAPGLALADGPAAVDPQQIREIIDQNRRLQEQVNAQQKVIDDLRSKMNDLGNSSQQQSQELQSLRAQIGVLPQGESKPSGGGSGDETVRLSGEVGFAYFNSGQDGPFANGEFRIDDAKVYLDAAVWNNFFLHVETDLMTREASDSNLHFGELYADIEGLGSVLGNDQLLNLRAGRMYIPFGEEYENRGVMKNPLITHSVSDLWGMDQGVEAYGSASKLSYVVAVQDGGLGGLRNFHPGKSLAGRIGYDPASWLHLSASGMTTSKLSASPANPFGDSLSALWFGNSFFRSLATTTNANSRYWADLGEVDASTQWSGGHVRAAGGLIHFNDNSASANDSRHMNYYYVEAMQHISDKLYGAVRFSQVNVPKGYVLMGQAASGGEYTPNSLTPATLPAALTTSLSRLSVGLGYQFSAPVVLKVDFSPEWGRTPTGDKRNEENLFSTELGVRF